MDSGVGERGEAMDGIILVDLRPEIGSKKTVPDMACFAVGSEWDLPYRVCCVAVRHDVRDRRILLITVHCNQIRVVLIQPFDNLRDAEVSRVKL